MSIIYDTRDDLEKVKLQEQADRLRHESREQRSTAALFLAGGWIADLERAIKPETRGWLRYLSLSLITVGVFEAVHALLTGHASRKARIESERLDSPKVIAAADIHNETNKTEYSDVLSKKTYYQFAEKPAANATLGK